ncbi:hypothetical protein HID58_095606, partial [Brassica napus]
SDDTQAPENSQRVFRDAVGFQCPPQFALECNTFKWKVQIRANVHANGEIEIEEQTLTTKEVWKLQKPQSDNSGQPDEDSGGFLGSSLVSQLSNDVNLLPIDYADWRVFAPHRKDKAKPGILFW